jgi:hypothetical protein
MSELNPVADDFAHGCTKIEVEIKVILGNNEVIEIGIQKDVIQHIVAVPPYRTLRCRGQRQYIRFEFGERVLNLRNIRGNVESLSLIT